ncbi:MAG: hypothetical protein J0L92_04320 [Deltaproteobacteria bacterium]|nr:hypothetical protein [Deltaproteobacteria bacterium]
MSAASEWLESLGATRDVVAYAETIEGDASAFWSACPRGDWLLAIAIRARGDDDARRAAILRVGAAIAELGLDYLPDDDTHARAVLASAALAAQGGTPPSRDDVDALERDADDAPDAAVSFARRAIVVAARATYGEVADFEDLALVPALVSQAAAYDAGDCAMISAASFVLRKSAELVRHELPRPE